MKYKLAEDSLTIHIFDEHGRLIFTKVFDNTIIFHCARLSLEDAANGGKFDDKWFHEGPWTPKTVSDSAPQ